MKATEIILALVLIVLAVVLFNPFNFFMSSMFVMTLIGLLIAAAALFGGVIWREHAGDEREVMHRMHAGRIAFVTGTTLLVIGIAVQSLNHVVDLWLVVTLVSMVVVKIVGRMYADTTL